MPSFDKEYFNLGYLDTLSYKDTFVHRLDPRIKLVTTFIFILFVVSFPKYEILKMLPFFFFPVFILSVGEIPLKFILKKLLIASPFALFVGIFNPFFDTAAMYNFYGIPISGGWVSYLSIIIKFILTVTAALLLVATTSFPGVCLALKKLKVPNVFVVQLLFLYRYMFVLTAETMRIIRARNMRSFGKKGRGMKTLISIIGVLFVRTVERSERIYQAMCSRGFDGEIRLLTSYKIGFVDISFAITAITVFIIFRGYDVTKTLGELITKT
ncbi:nickel transport protein NikQ [bacterium BMS3Abin10]|nr:nickel transport protein NikQ [bacterium BMS3Abin10]GBE38492.1 nickel transport protein NikQ [bacterium BMS3Bbin08]HDH51512.1 cobalt ECF transporter T component CbiQ [Nitrospirota bacterium]